MRRSRSVVCSGRRCPSDVSSFASSTSAASRRRTDDHRHCLAQAGYTPQPLDHRDEETDRQTDRQTDTGEQTITDTALLRQATHHNHQITEMKRQTDRQTDRQTLANRPMLPRSNKLHTTTTHHRDGQTDGRTDGRTDGQTDRQTDRQTISNAAALRQTVNHMTSCHLCNHRDMARRASSANNRSAFSFLRRLTT